MLHYERFQETVLKEAGEGAAEWKHILPAVPVAHRLRFMYTLRQGFGIPAAFDMVMLSQTLADKDYDLFVQQAIATRLAGNQPEGGPVEKFSITD
ncbi:MAG TPA: hypothetical protein VEB40_16120 [Flavipsychrobacter sp.]|nr:hypothetical protein [Flavipsychrobacter sp.]